MRVVKSVFSLNEEQLNVVERALSLQNMTAMMRPGFVNVPQYIGGLQDFFIHFYYEDPPLFNSEMTLIYMTRYEIIRAFANSSTVKSMKLTTATHLERSLLAAVLCTNIYTDIFQNVTRPQLSQEHIAFHETFALADSQHFFDKQFQKIESYPSLFVNVQSNIIKCFWAYIRNEPQLFERDLVKAKQFLQAFTLTEMRVFDSISH
ncbi:MAG: hypothetical protein UHX00_07675 [Caryophanon sp.]|nr:hypothetical protein [Caryophanon sp.]